jgi:hypothetical protein
MAINLLFDLSPAPLVERSHVDHYKETPRFQGMKSYCASSTARGR